MRGLGGDASAFLLPEKLAHEHEVMIRKEVGLTLPAGSQELWAPCERLRDRSVMRGSCLIFVVGPQKVNSTSAATRKRSFLTGPAKTDGVRTHPRLSVLTDVEL